MTVFEEIVRWSEDRPAWQRDALRRLVLAAELSEEDIVELTETCKSRHGLSEIRETIPLSASHLPINAVNSIPVSLVSIFHHHGVNALAEDQTLQFGPNLTLVYGDNGAGKTGYIRILKSACHARGPEKVLGNVVAGVAPLAPSIAIKYQLAGDEHLREWTGSTEDDLISRVSIFDTQSASVYLTEKTDVAFRPFGLDLFDKLVKVCKAVRIKLESDRQTLLSKAPANLQILFSEETSVSKLVSNITSLTKPESVELLANLTEEEEKRLELLEISLLDLKANDPAKLAQQLTLVVRRVRSLTQHFNTVEALLSNKAVDNVFRMRDEGRRKKDEAKRLREITFSASMLSGTGSETWTALWEAAARFSQKEVYPNQPFPVLERHAACVLCQQEIHDDVADRMTKFKSFIASTTERELRDLREKFSISRQKFIDLKTSTDLVAETIREIRIENSSLADFLDSAVTSSEDRRKKIVEALVGDADFDSEATQVQSAIPRLELFIKQLNERLNTLTSSHTEETAKKITGEARELRARKLLGAHKQVVLDEVERKKRIAAYGLCIDDTNTQAITKKSSALTRIAVSEKLKQRFSDELCLLGFRHVEVELKELGGAEGILYHKLVLTRAPGVDLPKVASEGEQRCLSIASFFAELSTADDPSGIVFDDPVSSMDYKWREGVARRLVQESKTRQVIVFTHDVVFLLLLKQFAKELAVNQVDQYVQQLPKGAGVCSEELPWVAMPVKKKIGFLKKEWQAADKLYREGHQHNYEKEAQYIYGILRESWERALEEVLLCGIVERFRPGVQTQHIATIADITASDCQTLETAMSKCSKWLPGHDKAPAARAPVPDSSELKSDIDALETWVATIRARRK